MEKSHSGDQHRQRVWAFINTHRDRLGHQGAVIETWRTRGGRRLGPYFALKLRVDGRQRSLYLGADAQLAGEVRAELAQLQAPVRNQRWFRRQEQVIRRELARCRNELNRELSSSLLYAKGSEIRGWRQARRRQ